MLNTCIGFGLRIETGAETTTHHRRYRAELNIFDIIQKVRDVLYYFKVDIFDILSCLLSRRIFHLSLPGSRRTIFHRDASSALLSYKQHSCLTNNNSYSLILCRRSELREVTTYIIHCSTVAGRPGGSVVNLESFFRENMSPLSRMVRDFHNINKYH